MISPISFLSNYTVKMKARSEKYQEKFWMFASFSSDIVSNNEHCKTSVAFEKEKTRPYFNKGIINLSVPNELDDTVEQYCKTNGIYFNKTKNP